MEIVRTKTRFVIKPAMSDVVAIGKSGGKQLPWEAKQIL
jgi:hypothetical protein